MASHHHENIFENFFGHDNECSCCDNERFCPPQVTPRYIDTTVPMRIPLPHVERVRVPMPYYIPIPRPVIYRRRIVPQYVRYPVKQIVPEMRPHYMPYDCSIVRTEFGYDNMMPPRDYGFDSRSELF